MYEHIYDHLSSFKNKFFLRIGRRISIEPQLYKQIHSFSKNELEYQFYLTRLYFINFYYASHYHSEYIKKKESSLRTNAASPTNTKSSDTGEKNTPCDTYTENTDGSLSKLLERVDSTDSATIHKNTADKSKKDFRETLKSDKEKCQVNTNTDIVLAQPCIGQDTNIDNRNITFESMNHKSSYKKKFQKKLFRYLLIRTHPDKSKTQTSKLFIEAKMLDQNGLVAFLFILAVSFGYNKKLSPIELDLIQYNTAEIIEITKSMYDSLPD